MEEIRDIVFPFVIHDEHCRDLPRQRYTVRSIYFDTEDLDFFYEKLDSVNVRKKLRVRTYDSVCNESVAFLEIKRKIGRRSVKERVQLTVGGVEEALNGSYPSPDFEDWVFSDRKVLEKFRFNMRVMHLAPVVLVSYEREAMIGRDNPRDRVTFDQNIRSLSNPEMDDIGEDDPLRQFEDEFFVLELKFDDNMPSWMCRLTRLMNLMPRSYSKYCEGINAWAQIPQ
jgi:SPX domain protein involved in polyphosphate accumulation